MLIQYIFLMFIFLFDKITNINDEWQVNLNLRIPIIGKTINHFEIYNRTYRMNYDPFILFIKHIYLYKSFKFILIENSV